MTTGVKLKWVFLLVFGYTLLGTVKGQSNVVCCLTFIDLLTYTYAVTIKQGCFECSIEFLNLACDLNYNWNV